MKYWAILKDSFYETIDFKLFYILIGLSVLLTLVCASFTFPRLPVDQALANNLGPEATVETVAALHESWFTPRATYRFTLLLKPVNDLDRKLQEAIHKNNQKRESRLHLLGMQLGLEQPDRMRGEGKSQLPPWLTAILKPAPERPKLANRTEWMTLIQDYLLSVPGVDDVTASVSDATDGQPPTRAEIEIGLNWAELHQSHQVGFLFGAWKTDLGDQPLGEAVALWLQAPLVSWIAGWAGIIIAIVVTAGFIPNMLRKGTIDFLLVKPISRPNLLLYKYMGGLSFVFLNAVVLVTGTWVAFGFTTGNWSPWYLTSILVLTFYFAILYAMSALIGVMTRSQLAAILITIGFWFFLFIINQAFVAVHLPMLEPKIASEAPVVFPIVDTLHTILPQPGALATLNQALLLQANGSEDFVKLQGMAMSKFSWTETITSSAAFIAVMLAFACTRFSRKDY